MYLKILPTTFLLILIHTVLGHVLKSPDIDEGIFDEEEEARQAVVALENEILERRNLAVEADWAFNTNITDENLNRKNAAFSDFAKFNRQIALNFSKYNFKSYGDKNLSRLLMKLTELDYSVMPDDKYREITEAVNAMEQNYAKVKVCDYRNRTKCDLGLEPELIEIFERSRDSDELKYYWTEWYDRSGTAVRDHFERYVELTKLSAQLNNFSSQAEVWLREYEDSTIEDQLERLFEKFKPLYSQFHGYVRHRLHEHYGDTVPIDKPIPMHLLGNLWGQTWEEIDHLAMPFPDKQAIDVTDEMIKQGYTPLQMFQMGDRFFQSLNMSKLPAMFWEKSLIEKPNDGRDLLCHASAWDFFTPDDFRIKMCTRVNMENFFTVHHELGHIQYFMQYQHLPVAYRGGANPGFHEAVGDVLGLSVSTPRHLTKIGLLKDYVEDKETKINQLFRAALTKVILIPFAYTIDKYRWAVFRGEVPTNKSNCRFWQLREEYSGIEPPVVRSNNDFDPPAKYHLAADVECLRYLVALINQFQFLKAACIKAGRYVPGDPTKTLSDCDIYESTEAGDVFKEMLALGASKPWPDAMEVMTGQREIDVGPLLEYFEPLYQWLLEKNQEIGAHIGWTPTDKCVAD